MSDEVLWGGCCYTAGLRSPWPGVLCMGRLRNVDVAETLCSLIECKSVVMADMGETERAAFAARLTFRAAVQTAAMAVTAAA